MEVQNSWEECSDHDEEALSFCDLVTEQGVQELARDSNTGSLDQEGVDFDFGFDRRDSSTDHVFPADDLFSHGFLLPVQYSSSEKSNWENLLAWINDPVDSQSSLWSTSSRSERKIGEILRRSSSKSKGNRKPAGSWRNDSLDSQSSFWSTSSSSQRKTHSGESLRLSNSKSKRTHKPPASKMSAKWRILTFGLMKSPSMKLEDMRLRQGKTKNNVNGAKNLDLRRSVSCSYYKDPRLEEEEVKGVNFEEKWRCGRENVVVKKAPWLKGWKTLARCPSLKSCRTSSNDVVDKGRLQKACKKDACLR